MNKLNVSMTALEIFQFFGPRLLFAVVCGALIGMERQLKQKAAGLKTNLLICVGAALYTSLSIYMWEIWARDGVIGDPTRVAAQIVSGIGFLGGGAIIQAKGNIRGLTTAANIWVVAAVGIVIGTGRYEVGLAVSIAVVLLLIVATLFEEKILGRLASFACDIVMEDNDGKVKKTIFELMDTHDLNLEEFDVSKKSDRHVLKIRYQGYQQDHKKFIMELWTSSGVKEVRQH